MLKVLIVDDSLIMRRNIRRMLETLGHQVIEEAKDGYEAIDFYRRLKPDLITMDITMPDMDGITAVKEIKKVDKDAKIIMVTSHGQEDMVISAIRSGASGYLLKPISVIKLRESIGKVFPNMLDETASDEHEVVLLDNDEIILLDIDTIN